MLPEKVINLVDGFIRVFDSEHPAILEFNKVHQKAAEQCIMQGTGLGGNAINIIGKGVVAYLESRVQFVWDKLQSVINSVQVEGYPELSADLKSYIAGHFNSKRKVAEDYMDKLQKGINGPRGLLFRTQMDINNVLPRINVEVDLFCAKYEASKKMKNETPGSTVNIQKFTGILGNVTNSQVTVYDYGSINQLLIDHQIPKQDRRELEDILDELKTAPADKKPSLLKRAEKWVVDHKEFLGAAAEAVGKAIGAAIK